jgi:ribonuclease HII
MINKGERTFYPMQVALNFSREEKPALTALLKRFPELETKTPFEEKRVRMHGCVVTLYSSGKLLVQGKNAEKAKTRILHSMGLESELLLGIDEAGRGESFGPLVVAGILGKAARLRELRDSKKISDLEQAAKKALKHSEGHLALVRSAKEIDAMRKAGRTMNDIEAEMVMEIVRHFRKRGFSGRVVVDGRPLKKGMQGIEFMVKADDRNPVVGAASVMARIKRETSNRKAERKTWGKQKGTKQKRSKIGFAASVLEH